MGGGCLPARSSSCSLADTVVQSLPNRCLAGMVMVVVVMVVMMPVADLHDDLGVRRGVEGKEQTEGTQCE